MRTRRGFIAQSVAPLLGTSLYAAENLVVRDKAPIIFASSEMLSASRRRLGLQKNDSWGAAWKATHSNALEDLNLPVNPYQGEEYQKYIDTNFQVAGRARDCALVFSLSGDERFLQRSRRALLAFSRDGNERTAIGSPISQGMVISRVIAILCYAYSLIYDSLNASDRSAIEAWMKKMVKPIRASHVQWCEHGYYGGRFYNNQLGAHMLGLTAIGFTLRDTNLIDYALRDQANPRNYLRLIEGAIFMEGEDDRLDVLDPTRTSGKPRVQNGEVYDRFRSRRGATQEDDRKLRRGLQYAVGHLRSLTLIAEIATNNDFRFQGTHPYKVKGPRGPKARRLEIAYNYYSEFYLRDCLDARSGYYKADWGLAGKPNKENATFYYLAYRQFPNNKMIEGVVHSLDPTKFDLDTFGATAPVTHGTKYL